MADADLPFKWKLVQPGDLYLKLDRDSHNSIFCDSLSFWNLNEIFHEWQKRIVSFTIITPRPGSIFGDYF
jgi:hypothetical protein